MGFEEFLPSEFTDDSNENSEDSLPVMEGLDDSENEKIGQAQFYGIITSNKPDWQVIIYDLIHAEQLDPWDIDIVVLTNKYFERVYELGEQADSEGEIDFYVSSKVLLAACLLLRIKSQFLLDKHIKSIDEILFGRKTEGKLVVERIIVDEDELPLLIPKTPLPRSRRVTLSELMFALNKAINTESRRIKREVSIKRAKRISEINLPEFHRIDLKDRIKQFYARVLTAVRGLRVCEERGGNRVGFVSLVGSEREEKIACFLPLLHLSNSKRLWLEQEGHLEEIWVYLYKYFEKNPKLFGEVFEEGLEEFVEEELKEFGDETEFSEENSEADLPVLRDGKLDKSEVKSDDIKVVDGSKIENVEGEQLSGLEKARLLREEKKKMTEDVFRELEKELGIDLSEVNIDEKIEEVSGFEEELD